MKEKSKRRRASKNLVFLHVLFFKNERKTSKMKHRTVFNTRKQTCEIWSCFDDVRFSQKFKQPFLRTRLQLQSLPKLKKAILRLRLHRTGLEPFRTKPDLITWNHLEPIQVFTRDRSGTGPERIHNWTCKITCPVLDPFQTVSRTVPCKQKAYPVRKTDRICSGPVPCKRSLNQNVFFLEFSLYLNPRWYR